MDKIIIKDLKLGDSITGYLYLSDAQKLQGARGYYVKLNIVDGITKTDARIWSDMDIDNDVYICTVDCKDYQGALQYILTNVEKYSGSEVTKFDFVLTPPIPIKDLENMLKTRLNEIEDEDYKKLATTIIDDNYDKYIHYPAATSHHHAFCGGLLYHSLNVTTTALQIAAANHTVNKDLLIAGALLHDIAKIKEYQVDDLYNGTFSIKGQLLGHLLMGCEMIESYGTSLGIPDEKLMNVEHIIASHHGKPEWGAIIEPKMTESYIVSEADVIDARTWGYDELRADTEPGNMSDDSRNAFYKPL